MEVEFFKKNFQLEQDWNYRQNNCLLDNLNEFIQAQNAVATILLRIGEKCNFRKNFCNFKLLRIRNCWFPHVKNIFVSFSSSIFYHQVRTFSMDSPNRVRQWI